MVLRKLIMTAAFLMLTDLSVLVAQEATDQPTLLARSKRKAGGRPAHLIKEGRSKKGSTFIDFEKTDINGMRRTPMGSLINQNAADKNYDFIRIRLQWHQEMIQSAKALDVGS